MKKQFCLTHESFRGTSDRSVRFIFPVASLRVMARTMFAALIIVAMSLAGNASAAIVNEPMTGSTAPGWVIGGSAYLSASTGVDPAGDGWLRLTEPLANQSGFAFFDAPFDISQGVVISFDYATWGGNGADGYSVFLFDGSFDASSFSAGASGGSLGYAQKNVVPLDPGLTGGYIGIGIDEFGNYSNPTEGRIGGPGAQANEVGVRGPFDHPSGAYFWLGGSGVLAQQLAFNNQLYRPIQTGAQYRKVVIRLIPVAAPTYLRVDTYVQFGNNQPLTAVVTGLSTSRPIPASVKIGYAASTGGQNNYHEIRNLLIDPLQTDIDLAMTKTVSSPSVTAGGQLVYTLTARNYGPANTTATNIPITDTIPALLSGATWTCAPINGGVCGAVSGSGNLVTTATLSFNSGVSYTIRSTVSTTAPPGSTITNTASLTTPTGITDYNSGNNSAFVSTSVTTTPVTVSGRVYNDANHNNSLDGGEGAPVIANAYYAKLFRSSDLTTALQAALVTGGAYTFNNVPSYDNYTVILSVSNVLASGPSTTGVNGNWIYTSPANYTLSNIAVSGANVSGLLHGIYNGSRISGKVINDNGLNGPASNANDGILNAAETGINGAVVSLLTATGLQLDSAATAGSGEFVLFTNNASVNPLWIRETNLAGYLSVNFNAGNTAGVYSVATDSISFNYTRYGNNTTGGYKNILFSDVPNTAFTPLSSSQSSGPSTTVYYAHTLLPGSGGVVSFATTTRTQSGWPAIALFQDTNCNGTLDGSEAALPATFSTSANVPVCILVRELIPAGALFGATDGITTRATFTFTNSLGPVTGAYTVTDTTTVATPGAVTVSGMVYNDANHSGLRDAGENSPNIPGVYAKLFRTGDLATMLSVTSVVQSSGTYTFTAVPPNDTYTIILSSTNTATYDPSFPNTQWIAVSPSSYTLAGVAVGGASLTNQNFGVFNGTRIDGQVLKDDGAAVGANANNGVQDAGETGIAGQTVSVCDNASCVAIDTEPTDANGLFSLYVPAATVLTTARVTQTTMPAGYGMVNYSAGTATGSSVNLASRYLMFTFSTGADVTGLVFSDVPDNTFLVTSLTRTGGQLEQVTYAHTFTPGSGGLVSFATATRTQPSWPAAVYYQDVNCNGVYDAGDIALPPSVSTVAGTPVCVLARVTIPATAPSTTTDQLVTRATFTFTSSSGPVVRTYDVADRTAVLTPNLGASAKAWTDLNGGGVNAGDILQYTITIANSTATATAYSVAVTDAIPANTNTLTVVSIPALATDLSTTAALNVTGITVSPGSSVTIVFNVSIDGSVAAGTTINNTATITQPDGTITSRSAAGATVAAVTGNKQLYLYDATSAQKLSRTPPGAGGTVSVVSGATTTWTLSPALQSAVTISTPVTVNLWLNRSGSSANNSRTVTAQLSCSATPGTVATQTQNFAPLPAASTVQNFSLAGPATMICGAGSSWQLTVVNGSAANRDIVVSTGPGTLSQAVLSSQNVISVSGVDAYIATYPSTTVPASGYFVGGQTVYVRAVVSDPFGSYDIVTVPTATIRDQASNLMSSGVMTEIVSAATSSTRTYEYSSVVPTSGPAGIWSATVRALEGTEGLVADTGIGMFRVTLLPSLLVVKTVQAYSDPINTAPPYRAIPGAVMEYSVIVTNSGAGPADNNSTVLIDAVPANMVMYVDTGSGDPVTFSGCSLAPACGLAFTYGANVRYTDTSPLPALLAPPNACGNFTYVPTGSYDANVKGLCINPSGSLSGSGGQFTIRYRMRLN